MFRRPARRAARRVTRRVMRRRIVVGGMVLLAAGGTAAAVKMSQKDAQKIEQQTGVPPEQMTEEELTQAMKQLGIKSIELDDNDKAVIAQQTGAAPPAPQTPPQPTSATPSSPMTEEQQMPLTQPSMAAPQTATPSYIAELQSLATLRDQGVITADEFEAKKKQLLGL
jgi:hypothetical protein